MNNTTKPLPITAIVLTFNEEVNIESCLNSVLGWCQEIIVVDSGSTDKTLEICQRYTEHIYEHPFRGFFEQWDWSLKNLPVTHDWVIPLDADHIITEQLKQQIIYVVSHPELSIYGCYGKHQYFFWDVPIRGFKLHSRLRLFRLSKVYLDHSEKEDVRFITEGKTVVLSGYTYEINNKEYDIDLWIDKHQRYSTIYAIEETLHFYRVLSWSFLPKLFGNPDERNIYFKFFWYRMPLYVRPMLYFLYRYVFRLGFLDGKVGFVYHSLQAFWFRLMVDIKIADLRKKIQTGEVTLEELKKAWSRDN